MQSQKHSQLAQVSAELRVPAKWPDTKDGVKPVTPVRPGRESAKPLTPAPQVKPEIRVADQLIDHLVKTERVDVFFGLPGGAISPIDDAVSHRDGVRVITVRHEADAVFAAAGYARKTGRLGVAMVTSGPGALNALNALATAHAEGLPVLLLAGEVSRGRQAKGALQDGGAHGLDLVHVARPITKITAELTDANAALPQLLHVISTMKQGRPGAALVTCPLDVTRGATQASMVAMPTTQQPLLDERALDRAAELLADAKNPLIFAGNGVRGGDGPAALRALAERIQAPVTTTPHGKGVFPESHPLAIGIYGLAAHPSAVEFMQGGFDCMIAIGTSFSELTSSGWNPLLKPSGENASLIQIDIEASRIGRAYPVDVAIIGDAAPALRSIANRLAPRDKRTFGLQRNSNPEAFPIGPERRITPQRAIWELQRAMPPDTRFTADSGEHTLYALHYLVADDPRQFTTALALGSMGAGIGTALGIAAGSLGAPVAAIAGDGGFAMSLPAIACAAKAKLPIVFAIFNDGRYGMCELGYRTDFGRVPAFDIEGVDIAKTAEGLGAKAIAITGPDQIRSLDLDALVSEGPVVLDIHIDREVRMVSAARFAVIHQNRALKSVAN